MARCERCGTSWLARHFHDTTLLAWPRRLPARRPLIIEGEAIPTTGWPTRAATTQRVAPSPPAAHEPRASPTSGGEARHKPRRVSRAILAMVLVAAAVV